MEGRKRRRMRKAATGPSLLWRRRMSRVLRFGEFAREVNEGEKIACEVK